MKKIFLLLAVIILAVISGIACSVDGNPEFIEYAKVIKMLVWLPFIISIFLSVVVIQYKDGNIHLFRSIILVLVPRTGVIFLSIYFDIAMFVRAIIDIIS